MEQNTEILCLPEQPGGPLGASIGTRFTVTMRGLGDYWFFAVTIDLSLREIKFESRGVIPHSYFSTTYAFVSFKNAAGLELYSHDFVGNRQSAASIHQFSLTAGGGERLYMYHGEHSTRCIIKNETTGAVLSASRDSAIKILSNGIEVVSTADEMGPLPTFQGNIFNEEIWAEADMGLCMNFKLNFMTNVLTISRYSVMPCPITDTDVHVLSYYLQDNQGSIVSNGNLIGTVSLPPFEKTFSLQKGWKLQIDVGGGFPLIYLADVETGARSRMSLEGITFQSVPRGLLQVSKFV